MTRLLLLSSIFISTSYDLVAQDIPLFSQKVSNALIYNPSMAGSTMGSATYTFRNNYTNVKGSPQTNMIAIQTPISNYRFGFGAAVYQEQVSFIKTTYASMALAYHVHFNKFSSLSMGLSAENRTVQLNGNSNTLVDDPELQYLTINNNNEFDVSYGMNYQNRFIRVGLAANRLATTWASKETSVSFPGYFSGTVQGMVPVRGGTDMFEPYFAFRKFAETSDAYDIGLYYTINNKIILGFIARNKASGGFSNSLLNTTLAIKPTKNLTIGYSREMILGSVGGFVGSANEITLRLDFNNKAYKENFRADFRESLSYRRKTLSKGPGAKNPKQFHKGQKKLKPFTPNLRYENLSNYSRPKNNKSVKRKTYKKSAPKRRKR